MQVTSTGSVRVDLVGGTLDLEPINLILPNVVTLNVATSLQAKVTLNKVDSNSIKITSTDYQKTYEFLKTDLTDENLYFSNKFAEMSFVLQIISLFGICSGLEVTLSSGAPAGSGLGGSSAMGMTLFKALSKLQGEDYSVLQSVLKVKGVEGRILNQGVPGYQDYFPAMLGGVLALRGIPGEIETEQLFTKDLKQFLEERITLVYSGISRDSGINNWDVYKKFFDGNQETRAGLAKIAEISYECYNSLKGQDYENVLSLIAQEGESRKSLAKNIVPVEIENMMISLKGIGSNIGLKMCGAGGGGCFILTHKSSEKQSIKNFLEKTKMEVLDFNILPPIDGL